MQRAEREKKPAGGGKFRGSGKFGPPKRSGYRPYYPQPPPPGVYPAQDHWGAAGAQAFAPPPARFMQPAALGAPRKPRACYKCGQIGHLQVFREPKLVKVEV